MKALSNIREFFWPLLEKMEEQKIESITALDVNVNSSHLEKTLEYAIKRYEAEEDRKKTVETKSSLFIGTISVVTSVVIGITSVLINKGEINSTTCAIVLLLFVLTIYMARTIWFSVQALERKNYHALSVDDFLIQETGEEYHKKLIAEITNKIRKNYVTINNKVDSMTMAQEYFKRSIVVVTIFSFCILLFFLSKIEYNFHLDNLTTGDNNISLSTCHLIIIYSLIALLLLFAIVGKIRKNRGK